jgi:hypothetical protein
MTRQQVIEAGFLPASYRATLQRGLIVAKFAAPLATPGRLSVRLSDLADAFHPLLLAPLRPADRGAAASLPLLRLP